jgi:hypothetical protein
VDICRKRVVALAPPTAKASLTKPRKLRAKARARAYLWGCARIGARPAEPVEAGRERVLAAFDTHGLVGVEDVGAPETEKEAASQEGGGVIKGSRTRAVRVLLAARDSEVIRALAGRRGIH